MAGGQEGGCSDNGGSRRWVVGSIGSNGSGQGKEGAVVDNGKQCRQGK